MTTFTINDVIFRRKSPDAGKSEIKFTHNSKWFNAYGKTSKRELLDCGQQPAQTRARWWGLLMTIQTSLKQKVLTKSVVNTWLILSIVQLLQCLYQIFRIWNTEMPVN